jgi:penicillin-binding protein 2
MGIGQGYTHLNPLQLCVMASRIANGRKALHPRLIRSIGGVEQKSGAAWGDLDVGAEHLAFLREAMKAVTTVGTAARVADLSRPAGQLPRESSVGQLSAGAGATSPFGVGTGLSAEGGVPFLALKDAKGRLAPVGASHAAAASGSGAEPESAASHVASVAPNVPPMPPPPRPLLRQSDSSVARAQQWDEVVSAMAAQATGSGLWNRLARGVETEQSLCGAPVSDFFADSRTYTCRLPAGHPGLWHDDKEGHRWISDSA